MKRFIVFVLGLAIALPAIAEETRILTARWVLDVERGEMIENGFVLVTGDRIAAVGRKAEVTSKGEEIIIAVEGNPLTDINALQKIKFVMKAGRPVDRNTL